MGLPGVELDVRLCATGELVIVHDHDMRRVSGVGLVVEESSWRELSRLDIGSWKDARYAAERLMLLGELFDEFGDAFYFDIEIKSGKATDRGLEKILADTIHGAGAGPRCIVSSFDTLALDRFKAIEPGVATGMIYRGHAAAPSWFPRRGKVALYAQCDFLKPERSLVTTMSVFADRTLRGRPIIPWTVDDAATASRLIALGCEGLISNRPQDLGID